MTERSERRVATVTSDGTRRPKYAGARLARRRDWRYGFGVQRESHRASMLPRGILGRIGALACCLPACRGQITGEALDTDATTAGDASTTEPGSSGHDAGVTPRLSGEQLFTGLCAACHGLDAEGTERGYELRHPDRDHAGWVIRNGRSGDEFEGAMLPFDGTVLSDADVNAIFDYLDSFPQPEDGEGLYADYCGNCHGSNARGGAVGKDISDKGYEDALEKVRRGEGGKNYGARQKYMSAFDDDALSNAELRAITDFVAGL